MSFRASHTSACYLIGRYLTFTFPAHIAGINDSAAADGSNADEQPRVEDLSFSPHKLPDMPAPVAPKKPVKRPRAPATPKYTDVFSSHLATRRLDSVALQVETWKPKSSFPPSRRPR